MGSKNSTKRRHKHRKGPKYAQPEQQQGNNQEEHHVHVDEVKVESPIGPLNVFAKAPTNIPIEDEESFAAVRTKSFRIAMNSRHLPNAPSQLSLLSSTDYPDSAASDSLFRITGDSSDTDEFDGMLDDDGEEVTDWLLETDLIKPVSQQAIRLSAPKSNETKKDRSFRAFLQENKPLYNIISEIKVFSCLSQHQQERIVHKLKPATFNEGENIVTQGEKGTRFYLIVKGTAAVIKKMEGEETECMITHLHAGNYFGELALLYNDTRSASVRAVGGKVELMYLSQKNFQKIEQIQLSLMMQQVPMLTQLQPEDQDEILKRLKPIIYQKDDYIVRQGEIGDRFYMITRGEVAVLEEDDKSGEVIELTRLYEGHVVGEMSLIYNEPRTASIKAITSVKCVYLTKDDFDKCLLSDQFQKFIRQSYIEKATSRAIRIKNVGQVNNRIAKNSNRNRKASDPHYLKTEAVETKSLTKSRTVGGEKNVNEYIFKGELGKGTFGRVELCLNEKDEKLYAVKIIPKPFIQRVVSQISDAQNILRREVAIMKKLHHSNVVKLVEVIDDPSCEKVYLVQEYVEKGNLMEVMSDEGPLEQDRIRFFMRQLLRGLGYLHHHNIIHRDLKPENILITSDDVVKIADFGAARMVSNIGDVFTEANGTPSFMAPEIFDINAHYTGPATDIWSLGATLYMMLFEHPPWTANNEILLAEKIRNDELVFDKPIEPYLKHLIQAMMTKEPSKRITLMEIIDHHWITKEGNEKLELNYDNQQMEISNYESEFSIHSIPYRLHNNTDGLREAHDMLVNRSTHRRHKRQSLRNVRSSSSLNPYCSLLDKRNIFSQSYAIINSAYLSDSDSNSSFSSCRIGSDSMDSLVMESRTKRQRKYRANRMLPACVHNKRISLLTGHNSISEKSKDLMLEQKRIPFSSDRADISEIILSDYTASSPPMVNSESDSNLGENQSEGCDIEERALNRKNDFLMVTSEVLCNKDGTLRRRKIVFMAKDEDFSLLSKKVSKSSSEKTRSNNSKSAYSNQVCGSVPSLTVDSNGTINFHASSECLLKSDDLKMTGGNENFASKLAIHKTNDLKGNLGGLINEELIGEGCTYVDSDEEGSDSDYSDIETDINIDEAFQDMIGIPNHDGECDDDDLMPLLSTISSCADFELNANSDVVQAYVSSKLRENLFVGSRSGYADVKGKRPHMEDRTRCLSNFKPNLSFWAIYDGHNGCSVADTLRETLHHHIFESTLWSADPISAIINGFESVDERICAEDRKHMSKTENSLTSSGSFSGSTAVIAIIEKKDEMKQSMLYVGNAGDSRAVLCRGGEAIDLSVDHKSDCPEEKNRIEAAGGFVHNGRLNGVLAISRAFGDVPHKEEGQLICTPHVYEGIIEVADEFVLMASDGLFDVLTSNQAINFCRRKLSKHGDVQLVAQELIAKAQEYNSHDNISVVIICLNQK